MGRLKTLLPRVSTKTPSRTRALDSGKNWGQGRKRYAPGRDARRERVFKRDQYMCQGCKEHGRLTSLELHSPDRNLVGYVDHWIPLAQGGEDTERNQWLLCKTCHDAKSVEDSQGIVREPRDFGCLDLVIS